MFKIFDRLFYAFIFLHFYWFVFVEAPVSCSFNFIHLCIDENLCNLFQQLLCRWIITFVIEFGLIFCMLSLLFPLLQLPVRYSFCMYYFHFVCIICVISQSSDEDFSDVLWFLSENKYVFLIWNIYFTLQAKILCIYHILVIFPLRLSAVTFKYESDQGPPLLRIIRSSFDVLPTLLPRVLSFIHTSFFLILILFVIFSPFSLRHLSWFPRPSIPCNRQHHSVELYFTWYL